MTRICFSPSILWSAMIGVLVSGSVRAAEAAPDRKSDPLPRYKLSVGQELVYRVQGNDSSATFYVTRSNPGGGWHVFVLTREPDMFKNVAPRPLVPALACECDLVPDGRVGDKPVGSTDMVLRFLPMLPPNDTTSDWQASGPQDETIRFHALPATQPSVRNFEGDIDGPIQQFLKSHDRCRIRFDIEQGLPVRIEQEYSARVGKRGASIFELVENKAHSAAWAKQIDDEASAVMRAHSQYSAALKAARLAADNRKTDTGEDAVLQILQDTRSRLTLPIFREVMDTYIERHPVYASMNRRPSPESLLGRKAPAWEFPDLKGQHHSLADFHGKTVVLDFCYRQCPWCIVEAPHLKAVAERYASKPVAFLAMNVDADPKDAQLMADEHHIAFPTLVTRAFARSADASTQPAAQQSPISDLYHVDGYPTLILIGPDGIIRHVIDGYNDHLEEQLASQIDSLLPPER